MVVALPASKLPAATAEAWKKVGSPSTRSIAGHDIRENECVAVHGASTWTQQGYIGGNGQDPAIQDTFAFGTSAAAHSAYMDFATSMAACQSTSRALQGSSNTSADALVRQTAALPAALSWERTWTGVMGISAQGPQTNHIYLALVGPRLIVLQFTEFPGNTAPYSVTGDAQVLAMLTTE